MFGRDREQRHIDRVLTTARSGRSATLALYGESGIGKSALLRDAIARADGFQLLECHGRAAESPFAYAALHELLLPLTGSGAEAGSAADAWSTLPAPQAQALARALGVEPGAADGFLVGAALVTLLSRLAATGPVLLVVDDAQLLDAASVHALLFALRRLAATPIALLCALREDPATTVWHRLPALPLNGLDEPAARQLLTRRCGEIGALRAARILAAAAGNPLALCELPITAEEFAGIARGPVPLGPRLRRTFEDRLSALPDALRSLLTVVAAEDSGALCTVSRAAITLGIPETAWEQAESAALLTIGDGRVDMRDRLLCAAAYDAATPQQRRAVHRALAAAATQPEHRHWHEAAALDGPHEPTATALTRIAHQLGGLVSTARVTGTPHDTSPSNIRETPHALSPADTHGPHSDEPWRSDNGSASAEPTAAGIASGRDDAAAPDPVVGFASSRGGAAAPDPVVGFASSRGGAAAPDPVVGFAPSRGGAAAPYPVVGFASGRGGAAAPDPVAGIASGVDGVVVPGAVVAFAGGARSSVGALGAAALLRRAAAITPDAGDAGERLATAARFAWAGGDIESARRLLERAGERIGAERVAAASGGMAGLLEFVGGEPERAGALLLRDAAVVGGEAGESLRELAERARWAAGHDDAHPVPTRFDVFRTAPHISTAMHQLPPAPLVLMWGLADTALQPYAEAAAYLRGVSRSAALLMLPQLGIVQFATGRWDSAAATVAEGLELARPDDAGNVLAQCLNLQAKIASLRGDSDTALENLDRALALARPQRSRALIASSHWHLGFHALSAGDPETAYLRLRTLAQPGHDARHLTYARLAALDMVEAAHRVGRLTDATAYYETIRDWAIRSRADWAIAAAHACRALLSPDQQAEYHFRRALAQRRTPRHDLGHARTRLLYGKWLRRARRRGDAAEQLVAAREAFGYMGATPWVERAQQELELTGRRPAPATGHSTDPVLTAQELRVARLAAQGLTNRAIGAELVLSPRTVGHHLSRIFGKLGLAGRAELADIDFDNGLRIIRPR
ncbi:LuxR family transcriptional regulator [Nocardia inohanensis]|uniref:AAA family ATPase n=1 Tax=Nocardia inohanensis TaxID=209246 RepID=UPI0008373496|nr:LuxR family transcriptional regulator [Nocardia inohanensis]